MVPVRDGPEQSATALSVAVRAAGLTPAQRLAALAAAGPDIARIMQALKDARPDAIAQAVVSLACAVDAAGPGAARVVAGHMREAAPRSVKPLSGGFRAAVLDGAAAGLGVELARQLRAAHPAAAAELERAIAGGMTRVHAEVAAAQDPIAAERAGRTLTLLTPGAEAAADLPATLGTPLVKASNQLLADAARLKSRPNRFE